MNGVYPTNFPVREYQWTISNSALLENTLVSLPTGLGKTLIASVLIANFKLWFPDSKLIFLAPTRPLVAQQLKACCQTIGLNPHDVDILLDKKISNRPSIWSNGSIFFSTPHVLFNDLSKGSIDAKKIKLIIFDEAHRGSGTNYPYAKIISLLNDLNLDSNFRVLALSATPGTDLDSIQNVITNLNISNTQLRLDDSPDVKPYLQSKEIININCNPLSSFDSITSHLFEAIKPTLDACYKQGLYPSNDPLRLNHFIAMQNGKKLLATSTSNSKWNQYSQLQLLALVGLLLQRLKIYGVLAFNDIFMEKLLEFKTKWNLKKSKNKLLHSFWFNKEIIALDIHLKDLILKNFDKPLGIWCHSKFHYLIKELKSFFSSHVNSKCILFVEFRDVALSIVKEIEGSSDYLNPHIFIGQSSERNKFDEVSFIKKNVSKKKQMDIPNNNDSIKPKSSDGDIDSNERLKSSILAHKNGLKQNSQSQVLNDFKSSKYNILVATSIGEEGLDIGEVDLIINFDCTSSVIKNLQRMGRTGRKREGKVISLFSGNEEEKFNSAWTKYQWIQTQLQTGSNLNYFKPKFNLLNFNKPNLEKKKMEIIETEDNADKLITKAINLTKDKIKNSKKSKKKVKKLDIDWIDTKGGFKSPFDIDDDRRPSKRSKLDISLNDFNDEDDDLLSNLFDTKIKNDNTKQGRDIEDQLLDGAPVDNVGVNIGGVETGVSITAAVAGLEDDDWFSDDEENDDLIKLLGPSTNGNVGTI